MAWHCGGATGACEDAGQHAADDGQAGGVYHHARRVARRQGEPISLCQGYALLCHSRQPVLLERNALVNGGVKGGCRMLHTIRRSAKDQAAFPHSHAVWAVRSCELRIIECKLAALHARWAEAGSCMGGCPIAVVPTYGGTRILAPVHVIH